MKNDNKTQKEAKKLIGTAAMEDKYKSVVNLAKIEGEGSFPCPKCGTEISPDDESEEKYTILDTKVVGNELNSLVISCCRCGNVICVTGFQDIAEVQKE